MAHIKNSDVDVIKIAKDWGFELIVTLPKKMTLAGLTSDDKILRLRCKQVDLPENIFNQIQMTVHGITKNDIGNKANAQQRTIVFYEDLDATIATMFNDWALINQHKDGSSEDKTDLTGTIQVLPINRAGAAYWEYTCWNVLGLQFVNGTLGNGEGGGKPRESTFTYSYDDNAEGKPGSVTRS
jgi:hypothetical protein